MDQNNIALTAPGVLSPVVLPYPEGAYSPRTAGIIITNNNNNLQTRLLGTIHGGKGKRVKRGGTISKIAVPTMQVLYPEPGAAGQTVNGNIIGTTKLGATSAANSVYDACIGQGPSCTAQISSQQSGGKYKRYKYKSMNTKKRGGVKWGCYSGGYHKRKNIKTNRKNKKNNRKTKKRSK